MSARTVAEDVAYLQVVTETPAPSVPLLVTRTASCITPKAVAWLWPGWLPFGMLALIAGYGGGGKSTIALQLAAALSVGGKLPDGSRAPLGRTLYLAAEDSPEHTLIPRLIAMGANLDQIHIVDGVRGTGDDPDWVSLRSHSAAIEDAVRRLGISMIVIDPVSSFIGDANGDKETDVRAALAGLGKLAERTGCAVLLVRHVSKGGTNPRAASRVLGSTAWTDVPRVVWQLADAPEEHQPDEHDDGTRDVRRVLGVTKVNIAAKPAPLWFVQPVDGPMHWIAGPSPVTIEECFQVPTEPTGGAKVIEAADWLRDYLAGGSQPTTKLFSDGNAAGLTDRTLRRALKAVRAETYKTSGKGEPNRSYWRLPNGQLDQVGQRDQLSRMKNGGQVATDGEVSDDYDGEEVPL